MASLELRVASIERRLHVHGPRLVVVEGGFPGEPAFASSGPEHRWERQQGEPLSAFEARVMASATQARLPFVILGGLGPVDRVEPPAYEPEAQDID